MPVFPYSYAIKIRTCSGASQIEKGVTELTNPVALKFAQDVWTLLDEVKKFGTGAELIRQVNATGKQVTIFRSDFTVSSDAGTTPHPNDLFSADDHLYLTESWI